MTPQQKRAVLLVNRMCLILVLLGFCYALFTYLSLGWSIMIPLVILTVLLIGSLLLLNRLGHITASRVALTILFPLATVAIAILYKLQSIKIDEFSYYGSRMVLLISVVIPLVIFSLRERALLISGISIYLLVLLLYEPLHMLFGVGYYQQGFNSPGYLFINITLLVLFGLQVGAFMYYKTLLEKVESELWTGNNQLKKLYSELGRQHEEIHAQTEKLTESQQQLQEANQLIEQQKCLLEAENLQLHQHLLENNKILEASNQELHSRLEEMKHFSYTISHNLRGPVASFLGLANLFNLAKADPENRELMVHAKTAALSLDTVIRDLSQVLQIPEGRHALESVDLEQLLQNILLTLRQDVEACKATVHEELAVRQLQGVKSYLHSILYNLLSNALKYRHRERGCIIKVRTMQHEKGVLLEVEDNGMGIDLQQHGHNLFKMYKRFHDNKDGKGLGLYLLKVQAELMGGYVEVQSKPGLNK